MRRISSYDPATWPDLDDVSEHFSEPEAGWLETWNDVFLSASEDFDNGLPDVHVLNPAVADENTRRNLSKLWDRRPAAVKKMFVGMRDSLPANDLSLCPFCNLSEDPELDHFLPKAAYPEVSLHGPNLVPICGTCNKRKGTIVSNQNGQRVVLFPPQDLDPLHNVLSARLHFAADVISCTFSLVRPAGMGGATFELAQRHFRRLNLNERLSKRAQFKLANMLLKAKAIPPDQVDEFLTGWCAPNPLTDSVNEWQTALRSAVFSDLDRVRAWIAA